MKKLVLSVAIFLGSLCTFAAIAPVQNSVETSILIANEFTQIQIEELPATVVDALKAAYPDATITKAYMNEDKEYKIEIKNAGQDVTVFTDATGAILKK
ncbi:hypothetical protein HNP99_000516 [Flavobacterium sp. 28A]|uniref:PepSY domain-containing protein n=1 Tax=Flavobacterium sp. 28A TaxID=2735895 RepID=UPI00156D9F34|nr:PepSY domain-containing protein [Flavobacterium sp. 28A]NRT14191.1 hypothetical protein [Flavobacterium sp. 28A]